MWLALSFLGNFLILDNLLDFKKDASASSFFKSNMIIQYLENIFYQFWFFNEKNK